MRACRSAFAAGLLLPLIMYAGKSKTADPGHAENATVSITAKPYLDKESIKQALGSDLDGLYTVMEVTVTPKAGKVNVDPDDFMLRTDKDGERTHPMAPNQVAGSADMVLHQVLTPTVGTQNNGPVWGGGLPGMGNGQSVGNGAGGTTATATVAKKTKGKEDPMLAVLRQKTLPLKETDQPISGFLIFNLEKQKLKDLELVYTTGDGPLRIRFK